ncbi:MAG TPA: YdeI/OmpD-associated family protein [Anaerolineales bacterium]
MASDPPVLGFETQPAWEEWLAAQPAASPGVWLKIAKKGSGFASLDYPAALESALCYGWIDGQKRPLDAQFWLQKFTPRRPGSSWSRVNCEKAQALIAAGRMQPAGLRQVELAQADGRWDSAYDSQSKIAVPPDLQRELDQNAAARQFFDLLDSANRYAILYRLQTAKKPETRLARLRKFVEMLANGQKIHP